MKSAERAAGRIAEGWQLSRVTRGLPRLFGALAVVILLGSCSQSDDGSAAGVESDSIVSSTSSEPTPTSTEPQKAVYQLRFDDPEGPKYLAEVKVNRVITVSDPEVQIRPECPKSSLHPAGETYVDVFVSLSVDYAGRPVKSAQAQLVYPSTPPDKPQAWSWGTGNEVYFAIAPDALSTGSIPHLVAAGTYYESGESTPRKRSSDCMPVGWSRPVTAVGNFLSQGLNADLTGADGRVARSGVIGSLYLMVRIPPGADASSLHLVISSGGLGSPYVVGAFPIAMETGGTRPMKVVSQS